MELIGALEPLTAAILLGMVAGVVELIKRAFDKDWRACAIILGAGITGALCALGFLHLDSSPSRRTSERIAYNGVHRRNG